MTLKAWLRRARCADALGVNARMQLKRLGAVNTMAMPYNTFCMHVAISDRDPKFKHAMFRTALGQRSRSRMCATAAQERTKMPYFHEPAERGRLCVIRYTAPHYTGRGEIVARNVELELAKRICELLNEAEKANAL